MMNPPPMPWIARARMNGTIDWAEPGEHETADEHGHAAEQRAARSEPVGHLAGRDHRDQAGHQEPGERPRVEPEPVEVGRRDRHRRGDRHRLERDQEHGREDPDHQPRRVAAPQRGRVEATVGGSAGTARRAGPGSGCGSMSPPNCTDGPGTARPEPNGAGGTPTSDRGPRRDRAQPMADHASPSPVRRRRRATRRSPCRSGTPGTCSGRGWAPRPSRTARRPGCP